MLKVDRHEHLKVLCYLHNIGHLMHCKMKQVGIVLIVKKHVPI